MANTHFATGGTLGVDLANVTSSANRAAGLGQQFGLLQRVAGNNDSQWVYVYASAAITQYAVVAIEASGTASMMLDTISRGATPVTVGIAQIAFAAGDYGFVATEGNALRVLTTTAVTGGARVYTTDTAGRLTTAIATAANAELLGIKVTATTGGGATSTPCVARGLILSTGTSALVT